MIQELIPHCLCSEVLNVESNEAIDCSASLIPCVRTDQSKIVPVVSLLNKCMCIDISELNMDIVMD